VLRTLTLILSDPAVRQRVEREIADTGMEDASAVGRLAYLDACLLEAARLFPPVTKTFHRAPHGASVRGVSLPAGMEILHSLPLITLDRETPTARRFQPATAGHESSTSFDPFLGGARRCPGRNLITFVSKAALAIMVSRHRLLLAGPPLNTDALPVEFPRHVATFRQT
jgi:cytochrome P450